ncbi:two-component sensor histidine kinase [Rhizocola hellebori]|uniref:histidine kinase n=1 Tax=Rhizocola hellebori TaxID=1392758 RepID=A0A8J3VE08_9ACTN|nr:HAMP domain-containing sensor histidine kinase [Rhizocola hellebori]GIH04089.1 two-component sensor histidine kinase [Rhizocola hellebori]
MARLGLRAQLTLLYAVPFFLSGTALLSVPLLQSSQTEPAYPQLPGPGPGRAPQEEHFSQLVTVSAAALAVMVVVSVVLGWLVAGRFLKPLRTITATARDISATNLHRRLGLGGRNEFSELGATLDSLFARLEAAFASQRHFVANASHELRTPLTAQRTVLQVAMADPQASTESLRAAGLEVLALGAAQERLIDSLLTLASSEQGIDRREPFDLADLAADAVAARAGQARRRGIDLRSDLAAAPAAGEVSLAESLVANLVANALRHNVSGGHVEVRTATVAGRAHLWVSNTGAVIPPERVHELFQPFQRLDTRRARPGDGHGLGLAIVQAIAGAHDATVTARARPQGGLDIEVSFPLRVPSDAVPGR